MTDKKFEEMLYRATEKSAHEMLEESKKELETYGNIEFSDKYKSAMERMFNEYRKREKLKRRIKTAKRAAVILIACFIMLCATIFGVKGLRIKFLNYILEMHDTHTELKYENSVVSDELDIGYIPEDFQLKEYGSKGYIYLNFEKEELYFHIIARSEDLQSNIDTEDASVEKIAINGTEALLSRKDDLIILAFHDQEYYYTVSGNIKKSEIIKISENLRYKR